jgi:tetratricopeptide (TPR) repeat protein
LIDKVLFRNVNQNARFLRVAWFFAALLLMTAGSETAFGFPKPEQIITPADLTAAQKKASQLDRPLLVLVAEKGGSRADDDALDAFASRRVLQKADGQVLLAILELSVSRARATGARFHPVESPFLICLSPRGMVFSRSQKPINNELIVEKMRQAVENSPATDRKLETLEKAAASHKDEVAAQLALADFLMQRQNAFEAIPVLEAVAHSKEVPAPVRIQAWADLVRAHFWIVESEKGRHEAMDLIAELGTTNPEAHSAAMLALGNQDATNPKRIERARQEFEEAAAAAPDSVYATQATAALAHLGKALSSK